MVLDSIFNFRDAFAVGAMSAAIETPFRLNSMSHNFTPTVLTDGRQGVNGALETVKDMDLAAHFYFKRLVVMITTNFTGLHKTLLLLLCFQSSVGGLDWLCENCRNLTIKCRRSGD